MANPHNGTASGSASEDKLEGVCMCICVCVSVWMGVCLYIFPFLPSSLPPFSVLLCCIADMPTCLISDTWLALLLKRTGGAGCEPGCGRTAGRQAA